jgi:hypothetical protein
VNTKKHIAANSSVRISGQYVGRAAETPELSIRPPMSQWDANVVTDGIPIEDGRDSRGW